MENYNIYWSLSVNFRNYFKVISICTIVQFAKSKTAFEILRKQWQARMGDVSEFMKAVKQRFSVWYNRSHGRYGPLWAYRLGLLGKGTMVKRDGSGGVVSAEAYALAQRQEGKLSVTERLRLRMRWLTRGAVIGSRQFVEEHLNAYRLMNGRREKIPPRHFARDSGTTWPESLFALRGGKV